MGSDRFIVGVQATLVKAVVFIGGAHPLLADRTGDQGTAHPADRPALPRADLLPPGWNLFTSFGGIRALRRTG